MLRPLDARRMRRVVMATTIFMTALAGACGRDPTSPELCAAGTVVRVSPGLEPTFSWQGGCRGETLHVEQLTLPYQYVWSIGVSSDRQAFGSPIQYGHAPSAEVAVLTAPIPLVAGRQYRVSLYSQFGGKAQVISATFIP